MFLTTPLCGGGENDSLSSGSATATCCCGECSPLQEDQGHLVKSTAGKLQRRFKRTWVLSSLGFFLLAAALAVYGLKPVDRIINSKMSLQEDSLLYRIWTKPPVNVYIKVFAFNVTNPDEFLAGKEKLRVQEVGPYMYREILENTNVTFNANGTVTYMPRRSVVSEPSLPGSRDPNTEVLILPNVALLGMASMLHNSSQFLSLGLSTLAAYLGSKPFLNITVHEYLWGYDDPLVRLASAYLPSWIPFRRLGLMDRMFDEGENMVTMTLKNGGARSELAENLGRRRTAYSIDLYNGSPGLEHWGFNSEMPKVCNSLQGVTEGTLFPRHMNPNMTYWVYRKAFCRMLPFVFSRRGPTPEGFPALWFSLPDNVFDPKNPDNTCYCRRERGTCLQNGLADISQCYYRIPLALSFPHFYKADPKLMNMVDGLAPNSEKHESFLAVQPDLGFPLKVHSRMQLNLAVHNTKMIPRVARFSNHTLPIFWMDWYIDIPDSLCSLITLVLFIAPALQRAAIVVLALSGAVLLAWVAATSWRAERHKTPQHRVVVIKHS